MYMCSKIIHWHYIKYMCVMSVDSIIMLLILLNMTETFQINGTLLVRWQRKKNMGLKPKPIHLRGMNLSIWQMSVSQLYHFFLITFQNFS